MYNQINKFTSMKKNFEQPELMVVHMSNNDIVTISRSTTDYTGGTILAPELRGVFDPSDDWANAGY